MARKNAKDKKALTENSVQVSGSALGLPAQVKVQLPRAEAQRLGVIPAEGRETSRSHAPGTTFGARVVDGKIELAPQKPAQPDVEGLAAIEAAGAGGIKAIAQGLGVQVVDVDAEASAPTETISLTLPRAQMDALKWLARSERQGVMDWLYNTARRTVNLPLWNALVEGRPEDELLALKASNGKVAPRPAPSPGEAIELEKLSDQQRLYYELIALPHDPRHPCGHCRKGNLGGRASQDGRICANLQYTLSAPCHWPPQSLGRGSEGGGCPGFAPKRG